MKLSFTAAALTILSFAVVPTAQADHDHVSPDKLAIALANQSREIVQEFQHHFPHKRGLNQRAYIICRLAESTQHEVLHRHDLHSTIRQADKLEDLLDDLEDDLDDKLEDRRYRNDRHVLQTVKKAENLAECLRKALKDQDRRGHSTHDHHNHGHVEHHHGGHDHQRITHRPGYINISKGGFSFGIRLR